MAVAMRFELGQLSFWTARLRPIRLATLATAREAAQRAALTKRDHKPRRKSRSLQWFLAAVVTYLGWRVAC